MSEQQLTSWQAKRKNWCLSALKKRRALYHLIDEGDMSWERVWERIEKDPIFFINYFVWTYDPRNQNFGFRTTVPFWLTPKQQAFIKFLDAKRSAPENGLVEKSRAEGFSWGIIAYGVWLWLAKEGAKVGYGSYKEEEVDKIEDLDSLLQKARFIIRKLPTQLTPEDYTPSRHSNFMSIYNPETESHLTGEVGKNIGRSGRTTMYFVDEHAFLQYPKAADQSLSGNTECVIYGSTVAGTGNMFYRKRISFDDDQIFIFDWRQNPLKDQHWYEAKKRQYDEVTIAQEIDRDYYASVEGTLIPAQWVEAARRIALPQEGFRAAAVDVGGGTGAGESVHMERVGPVVTRMECFTDKKRTAFGLLSANLANGAGVQVYYYDQVGVGSDLEGTIRDVARFKIVPINGGSTPTGRIYGDNSQVVASDRFADLRTEMWWTVRLRCKRTYEVEQRMESDDLPLQDACKKEGYAIEDLISLPDDDELATQLKQPTITPLRSGKIKVESKDDMRSRGIDSPDRADALTYLFSDINPIKILTLPTSQSESHF